MTASKNGLQDLHPTPTQLAADLVAGLRKRPRANPPELFCNAAEWRLFDAVTKVAHLEHHAIEIAARAGFATEAARTDPERRFSSHLLRAAGGGRGN